MGARRGKQRESGRAATGSRLARSLAASARAAKERTLAAASEETRRRVLLTIGQDGVDDVARYTGCLPAEVKRFLAGGPPSVAFVCGLCEHYGVSADWLLVLSDRPSPMPSPDDQGA